MINSWMAHGNLSKWFMKYFANRHAHSYTQAKPWSLHPCFIVVEDKYLQFFGLYILWPGQWLCSFLTSYIKAFLVCFQSTFCKRFFLPFSKNLKLFSWTSSSAQAAPWAPENKLCGSETGSAWPSCTLRVGSHKPINTSSQQLHILNPLPGVVLSNAPSHAEPGCRRRLLTREERESRAAAVRFSNGLLSPCFWNHFQLLHSHEWHLGPASVF